MADATQQLLLDWMNKAVLNIQIQNKVPIYERNLAAVIGGQIQVVTAPAVTVNSQNLSKWQGSTVIRFKRKIELDQKTQWQVNILQDAAANAALDGDYLRVETIGRLTAQL
jgi:Tfp pilus assembly protein FimT